MGYEYKDTKVVFRRRSETWTWDAKATYDVWVVSGRKYQYRVGMIEGLYEDYWQNPNKVYWLVDIDSRPAFDGKFTTLSKAKETCRKELTGSIKLGNHTEDLVLYGVLDSHWHEINV